MTVVGTKVIIAGESADDRQAEITHLVEDRGFMQFEGDMRSFHYLAHPAIVVEGPEPDIDLGHLFETGGVLIWISRSRDTGALESYLEQAGVNPVDALGKAAHFVRNNGTLQELHQQVENIVDQL
jgi:hypothetical protein